MTPFNHISLPNAWRRPLVSSDGISDRQSAIAEVCSRTAMLEFQGDQFHYPDANALSNRHQSACEAVTRDGNWPERDCRLAHDRENSHQKRTQNPNRRQTSEWPCRSTSGNALGHRGRRFDQRTNGTQKQLWIALASFLRPQQLFGPPLPFLGRFAFWLRSVSQHHVSNGIQCEGRKRFLLGHWIKSLYVSRLPAVPVVKLSSRSIVCRFTLPSLRRKLNSSAYRPRCFGVT